MSKTLPLNNMLSEKGDAFRLLFVKTMNLYLGSQVGTPVADKDKAARVRQQIEDIVKKGK